MIHLGLGRIRLLVNPSKFKWKAVHVAGTNGKGSVCAYAAAMLKAQGCKVGRFTSPHLIDRWDCIEIDGKAIEERKFEQLERRVLRTNRERRAEASPFELLTAVAFEAFESEGVDVGVVEVGMGGLEDSTNILESQNVLASVITKISMDHQAFLGTTLAMIAAQKAGIIKPSVPCIYDASNEEEAVSVFRRSRSRTVQPSKGSEADVLIPVDGKTFPDWVGNESKILEFRRRENLADHQMMALSLALTSVRSATQGLNNAGLFAGSLLSAEQLLEAAKGHSLPGRLQTISLYPLMRRKEPVLIDGAHNSDAAKVLAEFTAKNLRHADHSRPEKPMTWLYASSAGKDVKGVLQQILRPGDTVFTTTFGPVDGMPWVRAELPETLLAEARQVADLDASSRAIPDMQLAMQEVAEHAGRDGPLAITGSLYLVSDVLRIFKQCVPHTR